MAEPKLDPTIPPGLHLISAFLSMEPTETLLSLSRECGGGMVTEGVQRFIWEHCISNEAGEKGFGPYLKNFLKKLISEVESRNGTVLDELYEQCGYYMSSLKDNALVKGSARVCKCISFLFPDACELPSCPNSSNLVVPLHCSLNMLEGDTGCSVWPSSLFLSEFVLSFPDIFSNKSCFEVGSGVGLVGICLSHVKASQVILSDGDLSALSNMKINLELNQLSAETDVLKRFGEDPNTQVKADMDNKSTVKCFHLPWESATESELQEHLPDIILGADIIYDPSCLPHLVRVLAILLKQKKAYSQTREESWKGQFQEAKHIVVNGAYEGKSFLARDLHGSECVTIQNGNDNGTDPRRVVELNGGSSVARLKKRPVAYIASAIRNIDTFNCFLKLAEAANLVITDITEALVPLNLLPYMQSYNRSSLRLFTVKCK
ncbi:S-ADENOSYL-L-METHIONINE-DEPENDENT METHYLTRANSFERASE SUPERFAMILY PROTEIN [Salix koriyanagi]|uniref:S-ADENOSYL-L-METHIONINE-DEPENDENT METHYLTRANSFERASE SUPERFAMILY PROTEIN n=1 Tax=Salix koriyanagi TaxID=2511006 RepID=A0A9Q0P7I0_9ROSI|nr:S-ADENOSYL-L-METHIONINE-DEPENDENT METHYLTRANSFERASE SUPERFAMILY PROTEIN [Salix koriyanagi]